MCKRFSLVLCLWLIVGAVAGAERGVALQAVPQDERERVGFDAGESAALFVGVRTFTKDPSLAPVPYAVDDAIDLAHLFAVELGLIVPERVALALSGEPVKAESRERRTALEAAGAQVYSADRSDILRLLRRQSALAGARGLFLVGFATHGFSESGEDYLLARDSLLAFPGDTAVPKHWLLEALGKTTTPRRFALLDACRERLTQDERDVGGAPMSAAFHKALADARGTVVLAATTTGGVAYDDPERQNGVFTAAILDGLRGGAPRTEAHLVTAGTLAGYVDDEVRAWVGENKVPSGAIKGITRTLEGAGAALPLAYDPAAQADARLSAYERRRDAALERLRDNLGGPLTGALYDRVNAVLSTDSPGEKQRELLDQLDELDGSRRQQRVLAAYVRTYVEAPATPAQPPGLQQAPQPGSQPAPALLTVRSNVHGDTVLIDGAAKGPSGPQPHALAAGTYRVRVEKAGRVPWEQRVTLAAGEQRTLRAQLLPDLAPEMVRLDGGCFEMGSPPDEDGRDEDERRHEVCVEPFALGRHEVRVGEFRRFVQATGYRTDAERNAGGESGCWALDLNGQESPWDWRDWASWRRPNQYQDNRDDHPVACVSLNDAQAYLDWLNRETGGRYRLPTEAEWEYAARAGMETARYWGDDSALIQACDYANVTDRTPLPNGSSWSEPLFDCRDGYAFAAPVGQKRPNAFGLYDMLGNLWEWTCSAYDADYGGAERRCLSKNDDARRVFRGGSWSNFPRLLRAAYRGRGAPGGRGDGLGFRLARTP